MIAAIDVHEALTTLLSRFALVVESVPDEEPITGSFWGEPEAGLVGNRLYVRSDTPLHSALHEASHYICMTPERRAALHTNAGGDDLEESAVCYLQILLADALDGVGREQLMRDMDAWGYSFRLGNTARWFEDDADDARDWLREHRLIDADSQPCYRLRGQH